MRKNRFEGVKICRILCTFSWAQRGSHSSKKKGCYDQKTEFIKFSKILFFRKNQNFRKIKKIDFSGKTYKISGKTYKNLGKTYETLGKPIKTYENQGVKM